MKKFVCMCMAVCLLSVTEKPITVSVETGYECDKILDAVKEFYRGKDITVTQTDNILWDKDSTVSIGSVPVDEALGYGMWKTSPMGHVSLCIISRDDRKITADLENMKIGIPEELDHIKYISLPQNTEAELYEETEPMLSDLNEKVIDAVILTEDMGADVIDKLEGMKINTLLDGRLYEYVAISSDKELIDRLDTVIE